MLWFAVQCSVHWATSAKAVIMLLQIQFHIYVEQPIIQPIIQPITCETAHIWLSQCFHVTKVGFSDTLDPCSFSPECHVILTTVTMYATGTQIMLMDQPISWHIWAKIQIKPFGGTLPQSPLHCPPHRGCHTTNGKTNAGQSGCKSMMSCSQVARSRSRSRRKNSEKEKYHINFKRS